MAKDTIKVVDAPKRAETAHPSRHTGDKSAEEKMEKQIPNNGAQMSAKVVLGNKWEY